MGVDTHEQRVIDQKVAVELREKWDDELSRAVTAFSDTPAYRPSRGEGSKLGRAVRHACFGMDIALGIANVAVKALVMRIMVRHKDALDAVFRLAGDDALEPLIIGLIEAELVRVQLPQDDPGTWLVPPIGMGTAHVTDYGQHCWDKEVCVIPEMFNSARICVGPTGRYDIDEWWRYHGYDAAILAFAVWMTNGYEGEPEGWHTKSTRQSDDTHKTERQATA